MGPRMGPRAAAGEPLSAHRLRGESVSESGGGDGASEAPRSVRGWEGPPLIGH